MNNQLTARTKPYGYAFTSPGIFILINIITFFFQGCKKQDTVVAPRVIRTTPSPGQTDFNLESSVDIVFNRPMDSASVGHSFSLSSPNGPVSGIVRFMDTASQFIPDRDLLPNTSYTATISRLAKDKSGRHLEADFVFHFTTKGPAEYVMTKTSDHVTDFNRDGTRIIQIGEYMYSFGGWANPPEESYNDVYRSLDLVNWEKRPDAPWHGRHVYGIARLNGAVYIVGGDNLQPEFDIWKTTDGENWIKTAEGILNNRIFFGCTVHNGNIYIVGGAGYSDVWKSSDGITWVKIADNIAFLNGENFSGSLVSFNQKLWMICGGGYGGGDGEPRKSVWSSADGINWLREPDFAGTARYYTDVCVWDNKIWVVGGYNYVESNINSIWYMSQKGVWTELPTPVDYLGRHATGVGTFKDKLVIANGNNHNDCWIIKKLP